MDEVVEAHKKEYGEAPDVVAVAPGRFHLIGEHSWFFKDKTLSMAVNLPVYVAVSKRDDTNLR
ncbi:MAG: galactokinase family protein, partial [Treponema sp.]|nr:galactokinase family protein [Treponema sp.]